jgi:prophage regulatory protein
MDKLLRLPEVKEFSQKSTSRIYADMAAGKFPRPIRTGERSVAWRMRDLTAWLESRPTAGPK